ILIYFILAIYSVILVTQYIHFSYLAHFFYFLEQNVIFTIISSNFSHSIYSAISFTQYIQRFDRDSDIKLNVSAYIMFILKNIKSFTDRTRVEEDAQVIIFHIYYWSYFLPERKVCVFEIPCFCVKYFSFLYLFNSKNILISLLYIFLNWVLFV
ncbi:hypothetical protein ACJX0J_019538, partial [Zea mays]